MDAPAVYDEVVGEHGAPDLDASRHPDQQTEDTERWRSA
jgi:hypothetical protein